MKQITDHEGNKYRSIKDMCKHYGMKLYVYQKRRKSGWSKVDALTTPVATYTRKRKEVYDHKGNPYPSVPAMCEAYGIKEGTYYRRKRAGASIEEALTTGIAHKRKRVQDHLGNWYPSLNAMCKAYGVTTSIYCGRRDAGYPLEECLTKPAGTRLKRVMDHDGNIYTTLKEMCEAHNIGYSTYRKRRKKGRPWKKL